MTELKGWPAPKVATGAVLGVAFVATLTVNWPGHLSFDSAEQLLEGRIGVYNTWHPPVMAWLLGLFDAVLPGAALFVLFDTTLAFGTFVALLFLGHARWRTVAVAAVMVLLPQMLLYQGIVWKDVLFADAAIAGFVALAVVAARWRSGGEVAVVAMLLLLSLAALARQNGMVLLPFSAVALVWIARRHGAPWRSALIAGGGSLAVIVLVVMAATLALNRHSNGDSGPREQLNVLAVYDLSGAVAQDSRLPMTGLTDDDPDMAAAIRERGAKLWSPWRNDAIMSDPAIQRALANPRADTDALDAQWRRLMIDHPLTYLRVRAADFVAVFATLDITLARPVFTGVEAPAPTLKSLGLAVRRDPRDLALLAYGKALFGTPVWSHLTFAAIAVFALVLLLRRRQPVDIAIAAMVAGALAFAASFFVISISCDYRYLYYLDLSALVALFYLSLDRREAA